MTLDSAKWKDIKKRTDQMIKQRKQTYYKNKVDKMTRAGADRMAYKALRNLHVAERKPPWQPAQLTPGTKPEILAEDLADYFASISQEHNGLQKEDIPTTYDRLPLQCTAVQVCQAFFLSSC